MYPLSAYCLTSDRITIIPRAYKTFLSSFLSFFLSLFTFLFLNIFNTRNRLALTHQSSSTPPQATHNEPPLISSSTLHTLHNLSQFHPKNRPPHPSPSRTPHPHPPPPSPHLMHLSPPHLHPLLPLPNPLHPHLHAPPQNLAIRKRIPPSDLLHSKRSHQSPCSDVVAVGYGGEDE